MAGARRIIAVDRDPKKLEWARQFGATHTVNAAETDSVEAIRELKRRYPQVQTTLGLSNVSFGLNPAARIADEITEAKKAFGTVHIALGDSANEYGGLVECDVHLDGLVMAPTIEFDGVPVVVDGRHVYEVPR